MKNRLLLIFVVILFLAIFSTCVACEATTFEPKQSPEPIEINETEAPANEEDNRESEDVGAMDTDNLPEESESDVDTENGENEKGGDDVSEDLQGASETDDDAKSVVDGQEEDDEVDSKGGTRSDEDNADSEGETQSDENADMSNDDDAKDTEDEEYEHINQAIEEIVVNLGDMAETVESNRAELESIRMANERMTQIERGWVSTDWLLAPLWLLITLLCLLAFIVMLLMMIVAQVSKINDNKQTITELKARKDNQNERVEKEAFDDAIRQLRQNIKELSKVDFRIDNNSACISNGEGQTLRLLVKATPDCYVLETSGVHSQRINVEIIEAGISSYKLIETNKPSHLSVQF